MGSRDVGLNGFTPVSNLYSSRALGSDTLSPARTHTLAL